MYTTCGDYSFPGTFKSAIAAKWPKYFKLASNYMTTVNVTKSTVDSTKSNHLAC